jgi:sigma-B regulation protein RsbU (phosphoserine phosphatase)
MAILDTFHTLSYKGMPYFLIENSDANRATTLWIIARLVGAVGIALGSLIRSGKRSRINRNVFLAVSVAFSLCVLVIVTYFPDALPAMYIEGMGITFTKIILEYIVIGFLCFAGVMFLKQYFQYGGKSDILFALAIAVSVFSELAFVSYDSVYDIYNYVGHVYKFVAYFIVFRVAFIDNIEKPYLALFNARDKLKKYSGNLNRLVAERTQELQSANRELNLLNQKLLDDLEYARDIQNAILPREFPNSEQVQFDAKYYPAERVSGDFYNIFRLDEHKIGLYIGDVSGHGVPAAMLTVFLNQSIKTSKELDDTSLEILKPSRVLQKLYELYNKVNFRDEAYILIFYGIYDIKTKEFLYSSAGMNTQPLLIKKNNKISEIESRGLPLCNLMDLIKAEYTDTTLQLESGDRLFFYTDGIVELRNKETGRSFTLRDLKQHLTRNDEELFEELDRSIGLVTEGSALRDDITFFMMKIT